MFAWRPHLINSLIAYIHEDDDESVEHIFQRPTVCGLFLKHISDFLKTPLRTRGKNQEII